MKKLFFSGYDLDLGGIETALVTLLNTLIKTQKYEITLALEKKQGMFIDELDKKINVIEYKPSSIQFVPLRKLINFFKRISFIIKYKKKYDFSACFATYSLPAGFMARVASNNSALWVHADYLSLSGGDKQKVKYFFENINHDKYKHIVFVANESKQNYLSIFPELKQKAVVCNNIINYDKIRQKSNEEIDIKRDTRVVTFLNLGRHYEKQKRLTRIIEASQKLKQDGEKFRVLMVGDGPETGYYKSLVRDKDLENEIVFLGRKKNPYPYFKISDCLILTSDYEGYPVVFVEAFVLGLPILTTNVSDAKDEIENKFGYVAEKETDDIYKYMKKFIQEGYTIKTKFNPQEFNEKQMKILEELF